MKKTLLAAALLAGFAGAASAQSSVTLYGIIDIGLAYQNISGNDTFNSSRFGMNNGVQNGSRFGLRGTEDMGGGNRATFVLENGFDAGNGTLAQGGRLFGRQAWVGIENDAWGYVRAGRQYNFASDYMTPIDPFKAGFGQANMGAAFGAMNTTRYSNMLKYQTPTMSGFKAGVGYSFAPQLDAIYVDGIKIINGAGNSYNFATTNNTRALTIGANYSNGPLTLAASYDQVMPNDNATTATSSTPKEWILGGMYDFKVVQLSLAYGQTRGGIINGQSFVSGGSNGTVNGGTWGGAAGGVLFAEGAGFNSYLVGLTAPIGSNSKVFGSWTMAAPNGNLQDLYGKVNALGNGAANQNSYSLGYQYDFTKRTNMYAAVSYANSAGFISGVNSTLVVTGVRHQF